MEAEAFEDIGTGASEAICNDSTWSERCQGKDGTDEEISGIEGLDARPEPGLPDKPREVARLSARAQPCGEQGLQACAVLSTKKWMLGTLSISLLPCLQAPRSGQACPLQVAFSRDCSAGGRGSPPAHLLSGCPSPQVLHVLSFIPGPSPLHLLPVELTVTS